MNLTFDLVTLTIGQLKHLNNLSEMCKQHPKSIDPLIFQVFYISANLTLIFDLVTLTLGQLKHFSNVSDMWN